MKIINTKPSNKKLCDIKIGEVFSRNGCFYMKIEYIECDYGLNITAIRLSDGGVYYFSDTDLVELCDAELYIKG